MVLVWDSNADKVIIGNIKMRKLGILAARAILFIVISVHEIVNIFAEMNELTLVLRFTTLVATKTDVPEHNKLELPNLPKTDSCEGTKSVVN